MKPTRKLNRRSFMASVAGGVAAGGALVLVSDEASALQSGCSDSDSGTYGDPGGNGRRCSPSSGGCSDSDSGPIAMAPARPQLRPDQHRLLRFRQRPQCRSGRKRAQLRAHAAHRFRPRPQCDPGRLWPRHAALQRQRQRPECRSGRARPQLPRPAPHRRDRQRQRRLCRRAELWPWQSALHRFRQRPLWRPGRPRTALPLTALARHEGAALAQPPLVPGARRRRRRAVGALALVGGEAAARCR